MTGCGTLSLKNVWQERAGYRTTEQTPADRVPTTKVAVRIVNCMVMPRSLVKLSEQYHGQTLMWSIDLRGSPGGQTCLLMAKRRLQDGQVLVAPPSTQTFLGPLRGLSSSCSDYRLNLHWTFRKVGTID